jgi:hypothetical protein
MFAIPSCVVLWFTLEKIIQWVSGKEFSQKWSSNLVSATHSVFTVMECLLALYYGFDPYIIFVVSMSYFIYDIRNYDVKSIYFIHHIFSICALVHVITCKMDVFNALTCFFFTEIGNFPIYVMYCLHAHPNKNYLPRFHDIVLICEFIGFVIFRIIIVSYVLTSAQHIITILFGICLQIANLNWAIGMFKKVKKSIC